MGIFKFITGIMNDAIEETFVENLIKLANGGDAQTSLFTNVRRIDDVFISNYAIDEALVDDSPVWLLSDQGKILLCKNDAEDIIPPVAGDYISIRDFNARRADVTTKHFSYTRDPKTISNDVFAYYFDAVKNILICTVNDDAVNTFKEIFERRKKNVSPELARTTIEISRNNVFFSFKPAQSHLFSNYGIYLDGVKVGSVGNGESKILAMTAGQHELKLKNFFGLERSETINFEIKENQHLNFFCRYSWAAYVFLFNKKVIELTKI